MPLPAARGRRLSLVPPPTARARRAPPPEAFVPAAGFDFHSASPPGPITRSRRSSIYGGLAPVALAASRQRRASLAPSTRPSARSAEEISKMPIRRKSLMPPPTRQPTNLKKTTRAPPQTASAPRRTSIARDVQVVLEKLAETPEMAHSPPIDRVVIKARLKAVEPSPRRVAVVVKAIVKEQGTPRTKAPPTSEKIFSPRLTRSNRKLLQNRPLQKLKFGPASSKSSPKSVALKTGHQKTTTFSGTPKSTNPLDLLKRNLQDKVDTHMEDTMARLPNTSPYMLLKGETENGSPDFKFTKLNEKPPKGARAAAKYLTATPGVRSVRSRKVLKAVDENVAKSLPKRLTNSVARTTMARRTPLRVRPLILDDEDDSDEENGDTPMDQAGGLESEGPQSTSSPSKSTPRVEAQLFTGELARACAIM
eukprot:maker-scaffold199_size265817-snap-gene-1.53 protein:Tk08947 transcript:maker-scaffold199_size265817-snap-gene-1.53-mRNA-1 annotation:"---NA---"